MYLKYLILFVFTCTYLNTLAQFEHPGGLHSKSQLQFSRQKITEKEQPWQIAYDSLIVQANINLQKSPQAVADFNVPGYYKDATGHRAAMAALSEDAWVAYSSALAYQLSSGTSKKKYANKALKIVMSWANTNIKTSNYDGDLAMADAGVGLVFAAELMSDFEGWNSKDKVVFETWLKTVYLKSATKIAKAENNWGDWGTLGCLASYYFLNDKNELAQYTDLLRIKIDESIVADGSMPQETKRGKRGLWYTYFSLAPITASCQIAQNTLAINLFEYKGKDGAGIEEALDYLLRYETNPKSYPHYKEADLRVGKPSLYPGNLFEAMYGIYQKEEYLNYVKNARPIMIYGHHYAWTLPTLLQNNPTLK